MAKPHTRLVRLGAVLAGRLGIVAARLLGAASDTSRAFFAAGLLGTVGGHR